MALAPIPLGQGDAVLDRAFPASPGWYQDTGIHRSLLDHGLLVPAHSNSHFVSRLRIESNSRRRLALVSGKAILSPSNVSRTIWDTINRAFSLSSAGTTYQGPSRVLVTLRHST